MRRVKAKTKEEKCKYGRCLSKHMEGVRYCAKHVDKLGIEVHLIEAEEKTIKPSKWQRFRALFIVDN